MSDEKSDSRCICQGNWRSIIGKTQEMFGGTFTDRSGRLHTFSGVLWADDDFYYAMWDRESKEMRLLSCVGSIESFDYTFVDYACLCFGSCFIKPDMHHSACDCKAKTHRQREL